MTWVDIVHDELRKCTNCGLCLAACPTFAASRDEGDSPRGRVHLIASMLAGSHADPASSAHLSGCIECAACHPPCPTGVRFAVARRAHRSATESLDRSGFERRASKLADLIAHDPGADLTVRGVRELLDNTDSRPIQRGPRIGGVLALPGPLLRLAAPDVVIRLNAALAERTQVLVQDSDLSSALDRANGLLRDVGLTAEHDQAVGRIGEIVAARGYQRLTVAVFDLLAHRLTEEALPPALRVVPAPDAFPEALEATSPPDSAVWGGTADEAIPAPKLFDGRSQVPADLQAATAPVLLAAAALVALWERIEAKRAWLRDHPLITPDARDLVRFPGARHLADLMASGGEW